MANKNERPGREEITEQAVFLARCLDKLIATAVTDRRLAARLDREAIVHDTLLKALTAYDASTDRIANLNGWLCAILHNTLISVLRREGRLHGLDPALETASSESVARLEELLVDDGTSPSSRVIRNEESHRLHDAIGELTEDERQVIMLCRLAESPLTSDQAAAILGRTPAAVRGLLARAIKKLHERLKT